MDEATRMRLLRLRGLLDSERAALARLGDDRLVEVLAKLDTTRRVLARALSTPPAEGEGSENAE